MRRHKKVAVVVLNSVLHDARVIREAEALLEQGYDVRVFGVKVSRQKIKNPTKITIKYFDWFQYVLHKIRLLILSGIFALLATILASYKNIPLLYNFCFYFAIFIFGSLITAIIINRVWPKLWYEIRRSILPRYQKKVFSNFFFGELKKFSPHIVHCHDFSSLPIGVKYKEHSGCKLVYDAHEIYEATTGVTPYNSERIKALFMKLSIYIDGFITVNDLIAEYYKKTYPQLPNPVVVYNAVKPEPLEVKLIDSKKIHKELNISSDTKILLYQGGFSEKRGLEQVVGVAKYFPEEWCLVLMGWGELELKLKNIARIESTLDNRVYFLPKVSQLSLNSWTQSATCGLISYQDSCLNHRLCSPNKLWEYPRSGLPIIASDLPFIRQMVAENEIGWLIKDFSDRKELPVLLRQISAAELNSKIQNVKSFISRNNWLNCAEKLISLYERLDSPESLEGYKI